MAARILEIVTASTGPDNVTSVVHEQAQLEQALATLLFALTGHDELHPPRAGGFVVGEVKVDEPDRIVVHQAHPSADGGGWDYEFRGTAHDLDLLHRAVADFERELAQARSHAATGVALEWRPTVEDLADVELGPELSSIDR